MYCILIGVTGVELEVLWQRVQQINVVEGSVVEWREISTVMDDNNGTPTVLATAVSEAQPETVVGLVEDYVRDALSGDTSVCELWASAPAPIVLRVPTRKELQAPDDCWADWAASVMREWGIFFQCGVLTADKISKVSSIVKKAIAETEEALAIHRPEIKVGRDDFIFKEIASRNLQRFDLRLSSVAAEDFVKEHILCRKEISAFLDRTLGSPSEINFDTSIVYSRPGACEQLWHADADHQAGLEDAGWSPDGWKKNLAETYAIGLFIPLIDLNETVGFTQFWPASHRHRDLIGFGKIAELTQTTIDGISNAGDGLWYDYRLLHRGMPNSSDSQVRPVLQILFKKKWYIERANYGTESIVRGA